MWFASHRSGNIGNADLNTVTISGSYRFDVPIANGPSFNWGQLLVIHGGGDTITQIAGDYYSGNLATRSGNPSNVGGGGSWTAWKQLDGIGYGQAWQNVTDLRSFGTLYVNNTGRPIEVIAAGYSGTVGTNIILGIGGVTVSLDAANNTVNGGSVSGNVSAIVPVGASYIVSCNNCGLQVWSELR